MIPLSSFSFVDFLIGSLVVNSMCLFIAHVPFSILLYVSTMQYVDSTARSTTACMGRKNNFLKQLHGFNFAKLRSSIFGHMSMISATFAPGSLLKKFYANRKVCEKLSKHSLPTSATNRPAKIRGNHNLNYLIEQLEIECQKYRNRSSYRLSE